MPLRKIKCGEFTLTGIKTTLYPYEILLPDRYIIQYSPIFWNIEEDKIVEKDLYYSYIFDKNFTGKILINRIGPMKILGSRINLSDIETYKKLIESSLLITLLINQDSGMIYDEIIDYLIDENKTGRIFMSRYKNVLRQEY